ncbi:MAG: hypothetical protein II938_01635 [Alphaproteobacteria bacterium]|nr:hypothetical protein [Alphaproteobacteria bacterium]
MELQEYHVKHIFKTAGLPVLKGEVAYTPKEAEQVAKRLGKGPYFLKAQIVGGNSCYGTLLTPDARVDGCGFAQDRKAVAEVAKNLFGHPEWLKGVSDLFEIQKVYIEAGVADATALGRCVFRVNFEKQCEMLCVCSAKGKLFECVLDGALSELNLKKAVSTLCGVGETDLAKAMALLLKKTYKLFKSYGAMAVELSPIAQLKNGSLCVLDGRLVFDPNTTYKFPELVALIESRVGKERERQARENGFRYMGMKGNIACVVNGIGLGWATVDLIQRRGGRVAALLDVGTEPTKETVTKALRLVLSEPNVDGVLVNIFGGLTRCDLIAEGLIAAFPEMAAGLPFVVRMDGINAEAGQRLLFESRLPFTVKTEMGDAIRSIVKEVKEIR